MGNMRVLEERQTFTLEEKKSRFVAVAIRVDTVEAAMAAVSDLRDGEATHNCFAYRIGDQYRFYDDGEPTGTAGRPILAAIERREMDHCLVVVIRFFGGIKLGAGGLARAYGKCAAECLRNARSRVLTSRLRVTVTSSFDTIGDIYPLIRQYNATKHLETFKEQGILLDVELEESAFDAFKAAVADATRGKALLMRDDDTGGDNE